MTKRGQTMQLTDWLPVVGVIAGTVLGWVLGQLGQWFVARREERKAIARVLSELLEIRLRVLSIPKIAELISEHFAVPPESQTAIKIAITRLLPADVDLGKRYGEAVNLVSASNPILGYRLRSQDLASPLLDTLRQLSVADSPAAAARLARLEIELRGHIEPHLGRLLREVASMHSLGTWWRLRRSLLRPMEIPEGLLATLKSEISHTEQGASSRAEPPAGPPLLAMPEGFPDATLEAVKDRIVPKMKNPSPELDNFLGAVNGIRFRLHACANHSEEFVQSVRNFGDAPSIVERCRQETLLFGFFVSGFATLDSFSFFIYFAAAAIKPPHFPIQKSGHLKRINCKSTADDFCRLFPNDDMTKELRALVEDQHFKEWDTYRNVLAHRSAPGRRIYASTRNDSDLPSADWKIDPAHDVKIDSSLTEPRLRWLVRRMAGLIAAANDFTQEHS